MTISFIRTLILYCVIVFALRIMGKRQIGELSPSELVVTILASELASIPMQDFDLPLVSGIVPIFTLISLEIIISFLCMKNIKLRKIISGNPCIIVKDGKFDRKKMFEMRLNIDEVLEELRANNITDINELKYAIVETNGKLSYILNSQSRPATAENVGVRIRESGLPLMVVNDGKIIYENLQKTKKDEFWLKNAIEKRGVNIKDVFVFTIDEYENVFLQTNGEG